MPELKNTFTGGRMEKDLDERIVPSGLYREALNIGVSTSEDSDVGAAQNILGNIKVTEAIQGPLRKYQNCTYPYSSTGDPRYFGTNDHIVATVDPQTDMIYRFVATVPTPSNSHGVWMDRIIEYDTTKLITDPWNVKEKSVFVDIYRVESQIKEINAGVTKIDCNKTQITVCKNAFQLREGMVVDNTNNTKLNGKTVYIEQINYGSVTNSRTTITLSEEVDDAFSVGNEIVFVADRVLNFHVDRSITGLNIIDGLIFWTDNYSEPKKINIERSKLGSNSSLHGAGYNFAISNGVTTIVNNPISYGCGSGGSCYSDFEMHTKLIIDGVPVADCDKDSSACQELGCTDPLATNYDPNANTDDGSCVYPPPTTGLCSDASACNYDAGATADCDGNLPGSDDYGVFDCCEIPGACEECDGPNIIQTVSLTCTDQWVCIKPGFDTDDCADDGSENMQGPSWLNTIGTEIYQDSYSTPFDKIYNSSSFSNGLNASQMDLSQFHFWVYQYSDSYKGTGHQASYNPADPNELQTCVDLNPGAGDHRFKSRISEIELWEIDADKGESDSYAFNGTSGTLPTTWDQKIYTWDMLDGSTVIEDIINILKGVPVVVGGSGGFGFDNVNTAVNRVPSGINSQFGAIFTGNAMQPNQIYNVPGMFDFGPYVQQRLMLGLILDGFDNCCGETSSPLLFSDVAGMGDGYGDSVGRYDAPINNGDGDSPESGGAWVCKGQNIPCVFDPNVSVGGQAWATQADCEANSDCNTSYKSWDCVGGICTGLTTGSGLYPTLTRCQSYCVTPSWDCISAGNCQDPGDGSGQYATLPACNKACPGGSSCNLTWSDFWAPANGDVKSCTNNAKLFLNIKTKPCVCEDDEPQVLKSGSNAPWAQHFYAQSECVQNDGSYDFANWRYTSMLDEATCLASNCYDPLGIGTLSSPLQWNNLRDITDLKNPSPLKSQIGSAIAAAFSSAQLYEPALIENPIRGGGNIEHQFDYLCRPVYVQEKHVTVIRKGPTAPPKLQMYKFEDDADIEDIFDAVNNPTGSGITKDDKIIVQTTFSGRQMPQASNWDIAITGTPDDSGGCGGPATPVGTGTDGSDVSIFYTPTKELLAPDAEVILPIDIFNPQIIGTINTVGGQGSIDWKSNDKLLITYSFVDTSGNTITATCRVIVIDPVFPVWDSTTAQYCGGNLYNTNLGPYDTVGGVLCKVLQISNEFPVTGTKVTDVYTVKKELPPALFEKKFPKFCYRYKYKDGEYSVFGPWSEIAFMPGKFDYLPKKGYNLGMVNTMRSLKILDWNPKSRPKDVVEIDLLYKESNSPNVYTVKTFKPSDAEWKENGTGANKGVVAIQSELIHKTVPSNQMLRPWDNVPRVALGQEITANRLVFANYVQNYNMDDVVGDEAKPVFSTSVNTNVADFDAIEKKEPLKSLKSMRNYQIGVVYRDRYGRETPVLTDVSGSVDIPKKDAKYQNRLQVKMLSNPPAWAESFTFYIKETSNEYYNLSMDRWYNADDDGIWLSFPSSERNKLSERSVLLLKKQHNSDTAVDSDVKYKVIDIKNDAPLFIKTEFQFWGSLPMMLPPPGWGVDGRAGNWDTGMFHLTGLPLPNRLYLDVYAEYFDQSVLSGLMGKPNAQVRITQSSGQSSSYNAAASQSVNKSHWYDVSAISYIGSPAEMYEEEITQPSGAVITQEVEIPGQAEQIVRITLENIMGEDMAFCEPTDNLSLSRGLSIEARTSIVRDKSQFQGRFFVKILRDSEIQSHIVQSGKSAEDYWQVLMNRDVKYIAMSHPGTQSWMNGKTGTVGAGKGRWYGNLNELGQPTNCNYIPVGKKWSAITDPLDDVKYEVSSYHVNAGDASYRKAGGALDGPPTAGDFWPMGPGYRTNAAYKGGWWYTTYIDFINTVVADKYYDCYEQTVGAGGTDPVSNCSPGGPGAGSLTTTPPTYSPATGSIWPDFATTKHNWPSFMLHEWEPRTCADCANLDGTFFPGGDFDAGIDLSLADIGNKKPPFKDLDGANPMNVPAIWGDQSDLLGYTLSGGTRTDIPFLNTNFGGNITRNHPSEYNDTTIEKLRSGFYYLWHGRKQVHKGWPMGSFEPERWFIDKCGAAKGYSGAGIWETEIGGTRISKMDLSFYGIGSMNAHQRNHNTNVEQPNATAFGELMATVGTQFRFQQDPNQTVYTVTNAKVSGQDGTSEIFNYETSHGGWGVDDGNGVSNCVGGGGLGSNTCPPWGSKNPSTNSIAGKSAFFSDLFSSSREKNGSAPYNYRTRVTITLNKEIGTEGPALNSNGGFHPIKNHVNEDGDCNVKGGPKVYSANGPQGHWKAQANTFPEEVGGTPNLNQYYNLSSYWNVDSTTSTATTINTQGQSSVDGVGNVDGQRFGLHERGLNSTTIEIITPYKGDEGDKLMSNNPAVWETEPMEDVGLDIYYAASPSYPVSLDKIKSDENRPDTTDIVDGNLTNAHYVDYNWRGEEVIPVGAHVMGYGPLLSATSWTNGAYVTGVQGNMIWVNNPLVINVGNQNTLTQGHTLRFSWNGEGYYYGARVDNQFVEVEVEQGQFFNQFKIRKNSHDSLRSLSYFNCYSFSNGVESNRVRDDYNAVTIDKGVKASMPLAEGYEEERKASSLIFSGIYNSTSGINRTNQFIQAEPITKDLNPVNGSIQKLFARDTDLVTFCENKVFKILAKKDALFNADGNTNVTSNAAVLGQAIPFTGEYGISTNPESFASQSYRVYFADKSRGAILRLSRDGLTTISDKGMKDWFKDNLWGAEKIIGSYDDRKNQYNVTLETSDQNGTERGYTLSYVENKKGWVSFKSFVQQDGISHKNIYYTFASNKYSLRTDEDPWGVSYGPGFNLAEMWQHNFDIRFTRSVTVSSLGTATIDVNNSNENVILVGMNAVGNGIPIDTVVDEVDCSGTFCRVVFSNNVWLNNGQDVDFSIARNNFYNMNHYSMVKTLFNKDQGNVKRFKTLNYEGSQSKVIYLDPVDDMTSNFTLHDWLGNAYNDASIQMMRDNYPKKGWYAHNLLTDLQTGSIKEFVDKEHKWFNYIKGQEGGGTGDILDTGDFSLQGLGIPGDEGPEAAAPTPTTTPPTSSDPGPGGSSGACDGYYKSSAGSGVTYPPDGTFFLEIYPSISSDDLPWTYQIKNTATGALYTHYHGPNPNGGYGTGPANNPQYSPVTKYRDVPAGTYEFKTTTASGCVETEILTLTLP